MDVGFWVFCVYVRLVLVRMSELSDCIIMYFVRCLLVLKKVYIVSENN